MIILLISIPHSEEMDLQPERLRVYCSLPFLPSCHCLSLVTLPMYFTMAGRMAFFRSALLSLLSPIYVHAQTTTATASAISSLAGDPVFPSNPFTPLTVTGQFPMSYSEFVYDMADSQSSSATYPVWTCTSDCGSLSGGVGFMVFPAITTTGAYVQDPPTGYPALGISGLAVVTDSTFSTSTPIDVQ